MHCGGTFVAPSHFLSTNRDVNLFMYVALMRSLFMVMKHDQDGASLARVANSNNHPYAKCYFSTPKQMMPKYEEICYLLEMECEEQELQATYYNLWTTWKNKRDR